MEESSFLKEGKGKTKTIKLIRYPRGPREVEVIDHSEQKR